MSILQDYAKIRSTIGEKTFKNIEKYLESHKDKFLSDVYYNEKTWEDFKAWEKENCWLLINIVFKQVYNMGMTLYLCFNEKLF